MSKTKVEVEKVVKVDPGEVHHQVGKWRNEIEALKDELARVPGQIEAAKRAGDPRKIKVARDRECGIHCQMLDVANAHRAGLRSMNEALQPLIAEEERQATARIEGLQKEMEQAKADHAEFLDTQQKSINQAIEDRASLRSGHGTIHGAWHNYGQELAEIIKASADKV